MFDLKEKIFPKCVQGCLKPLMVLEYIAARMSQRKYLIEINCGRWCRLSFSVIVRSLKFREHSWWPFKFVLALQNIERDFDMD